MRITIPICCAGILIGGLLHAQRISDLPTVAEASNWEATSHHKDVVAFCQELAARSPLVHTEVVGHTSEKRSLPILVIADPPVSKPEEVGDRLVAFAWAGIHSGEVCGKPATLMLAREMAGASAHPLLEHLVVVLLPLLNADGNDRMDKKNRRRQVGPVQGRGTRANAQGLNINRDWTKLDTTEARAVVSVLNRWDPAIAMDLHTTNGSRHGYVLTYDGQRHPACDDAVRKLTRYELLPDVTNSLEKYSGYKTYFYGNFRKRNTEWIIDPALPRYSTHYVGLRHKISILSEAYSYASYPDRVMGTLAFVRHSFQWVADHRAAVRSTILSAKKRDTERGRQLAAGNLVPLRRESELLKQTVGVWGFEGGKPKEFQVFYNDKSRATVSVRRPHAYLVPSKFTKALDNLQAHGVRTEKIQSPTNLDVEVYRITAASKARFDYEGHRLVRVQVERRQEKREIPTGTVLVRTAQSLGTLAAYLLEPQSEDGLCAWNFFDSDLRTGEDFPVLRVPSAPESK